VPPSPARPGTSPAATPALPRLFRPSSPAEASAVAEGSGPGRAAVYAQGSGTFAAHQRSVSPPPVFVRRRRERCPHSLVKRSSCEACRPRQTLLRPLPRSLQSCRPQASEGGQDVSPSARPWTAQLAGRSADAISVGRLHPGRLSGAGAGRTLDGRLSSFPPESAAPRGRLPYEAGGRRTGRR
jgi:hypothetical protein